MPGVGFIGGKLSVIGGYSWPGGVDLLEEFDEVRKGRFCFGRNIMLSMCSQPKPVVML